MPRKAKRARLTVEPSERSSREEVAPLLAALEKLVGGDLGVRVPALGGRLERVASALNAAVEALWPPIAQAISVLESAELGVVDARAGLERASAVTTRSSTSLDGAVDRVRALATRASGIGGSLRLIDEIAARTNLVALNAAIESGRSGTGGRGFAIVAEEVRKLSERTAEGSRDIGASAAALVEEIGTSLRALEEAQAHLREVSDAVAQAAGTVVEVGRDTHTATDKLARLTGPDPGGEKIARLRKRRDELDREVREILASGVRSAEVAEVLREIESLASQAREGLD